MYSQLTLSLRVSVGLLSKLRSRFLLSWFSYLPALWMKFCGQVMNIARGVFFRLDRVNIDPGLILWLQMALGEA